MRMKGGILGAGGGGSGGGLTIPDTELHIQHVQDLVLHTSNTIALATLFSDVLSGEPWATADGSGKLLLDKGIYFHWVAVTYDACVNDCDFRLALNDPGADLLGVAANFHVPATTTNLLAATGSNVYPVQSGLELDLQAGNAVDPSFTITSVDVYTIKIA